jgi:hypothetical protein
MSEKSITLKALLKNIDAKIAHIEDITADNRAVIIKLVKQNNQIVSFLRNLRFEEDVDDYRDISVEFPSNVKKVSRFKQLKELVEEFMTKHKDLKEFEEELKKHRDKITPGEFGES